MKIKENARGFFFSLSRSDAGIHRLYQSSPNFVETTYSTLKSSSNFHKISEEYMESKIFWQKLLESNYYNWSIMKAQRCPITETRKFWPQTMTSTVE